jgi:hypothetical protein
MVDPSSRDREREQLRPVFDELRRDPQYQANIARASEMFKGYPKQYSPLSGAAPTVAKSAILPPGSND